MRSSPKRTICVVFTLLCFVFLCGFHPVPVKKARTSKLPPNQLGSGVPGAATFDGPLSGGTQAAVRLAGNLFERQRVLPAAPMLVGRSGLEDFLAGRRRSKREHPLRAPTLSSISTSKQVAIVIDDLGNGQKGTDQIFSVHAPLTVAIMPFLKTSKEDAIKAHQAGFEVLLHLPMEPVHGKKSWLGPGAITTNMSDREIKDQLRKDIESIPFVAGVNNHMGSKATSNPRVMKAVLEVLKEKNLFILDSRTCPNSKIPEMARQLGVPCVERTVFLDNKKSKSHIKQQLRFLMTQARNRGFAVGIGHVGKQGQKTAEVIQDMLSKINEPDFRSFRFPNSSKQKK